MKKKNKIKIETTTSNNEIYKVIKIVIGLIIVLAITYLIAGLMTGQFKSKKKTETAAEIQYEEILAGESLNRSDSEYYVMYFNFTDNIASSYITFKDTYLKKDDAKPFYLVDIEKGFNHWIVSDEYQNLKDRTTLTIDDLKVNNPTILKISNHRVLEQISGKEEVLKFLGEISK